MENFRLRSEVSDQRAINEWPNQEPSRRVEFLHVEVVGCIVIKRERRFTWGSDLHPRVATSSIELRHFEDLLYSLLPLYAKFQCHRIMDHNPRRSAVEVCASTTVKVVKWSSCGFIRCWPSSVISFASGITLKVCFRSLPTPELFIEETREQHKRSGGPWSFGWLEWNRREKLIFSQKFASSDKEWFYTPNQFECFFFRGRFPTLSLVRVRLDVFARPSRARESNFFDGLCRDRRESWRPKKKVRVKNSRSAIKWCEWNSSSLNFRRSRSKQSKLIRGKFLLLVGFRKLSLRNSFSFVDGRCWSVEFLFLIFRVVPE